MVCLLDLPGRRLILTCGPCARRGEDLIDRLRRRYGDTAGVTDVVTRLTQSCRHQQGVGFPPRRYGPRCTVEVDTDEPSNGRGTGRSRG